MKFGLADRDWHLVELLAINPLKQLGASVYLFGSRARGNHKTFSDVDILFESPIKIPLMDILKIKAMVEDSSISVKVDIVSWDETPESFQNGILATRIPL